MLVTPLRFGSRELTGPRSLANCWETGSSAQLVDACRSDGLEGQRLDAPIQLDPLRSSPRRETFPLASPSSADAAICGWMLSNGPRAHLSCARHD
jgi:hypothetical protein